jgi:hypothetical protein
MKRYRMTSRTISDKGGENVARRKRCAHCYELTDNKERNDPLLEGCYNEKLPIVLCDECYRQRMMEI